MKHHPILSRIDEARGEHLPRFATAPNADDLETLARTLVDEYWGEYALLTGNVPEAAFAMVCEQLEARRKRLKLAVSHSISPRSRTARDAVLTKGEQKAEHTSARTRVA